MIKTIKEKDIKGIVVKDSIKMWTLNYTDIVKNSNKFYNLEILNTNNGIVLYTVYGRVGVNGVKEYRVYADASTAEKEAEKIIKSKIKKGYQEVKLISASVGSDVGKSKVENSVSIETLKNVGVKIKEQNSSKLSPEVQDLIRCWFGATQQFVNLNLDTKKCPLGQLSLDQIDKAKQILSDARALCASKSPDITELNRLTSSYYSNIPHVLPHRINADILRFDSNAKVDAALDILDVFADAKNIQNVISSSSAIDSQYATLNSDIEYVNPEDPTWKWIDAMMHDTRASNHHFLGKLKTHKVFKLKRKNEESYFLNNAERIAKECGSSNPSEVYAKLVKARPDVPKNLKKIYEAANVMPCWHGTRRANMIGISTKGFLIRPAGVIHAGSAYGDGVYFGTNSTKSINYTDVKGSYWAQGNNKTAYLFLCDVALGNTKMASGSYFYNKNNIKPYHSVWAKAGKGGVINDEMIVYDPAGQNQQFYIKYIIEFETLVK